MSLFHHSKHSQAAFEAKKAELEAQRVKDAAQAQQQIEEQQVELERRKINKKSVAAARASFRRPGFLDSEVEGTKDVLG